jgi:hypothetical protein
MAECSPTRIHSMLIQTLLKAYTTHVPIHFNDKWHVTGVEVDFSRRVMMFNTINGTMTAMLSSLGFQNS